ncbi:MAG: 4Fe-4S binding protein [Chitinispirillaceae bacterium]|nr:4Fe-4S binding protein [Chitinispirillaceae bacterium]
MKANYGYKDGSGDFFITVDTDKCTGCGDCAKTCPAGVLELVDNGYDIDAETPIAAVKKEHSKKIKYSCAPCKPAAGYTTAGLPCVKACTAGVIDHSW